MGLRWKYKTMAERRINVSYVDPTLNQWLADVL